jgi:hypothetical protein
MSRCVVCRRGVAGVRAASAPCTQGARRRGHFPRYPPVRLHNGFQIVADDLRIATLTGALDTSTISFLWRGRNGEFIRMSSGQPLVPSSGCMRCVYVRKMTSTETVY